MTPQEIQWEQYNLPINNRCRRQYQCHHLEMTHYTSLTHGDHKDNHKDNHQPILDQSCPRQATNPAVLGGYAPNRQLFGTNRGRSPTGIRFTSLENRTGRSPISSQTSSQGNGTRNLRRRVSEDDEVSSAHSSNNHSTVRQSSQPPVHQATNTDLLTGSKIPRLHGYTAPPVLQPIQYVGTLQGPTYTQRPSPVETLNSML